MRVIEERAAIALTLEGKATTVAVPGMTETTVEDGESIIRYTAAANIYLVDAGLPMVGQSRTQTQTVNTCLFRFATGRLRQHPVCR